MIRIITIPEVPIAYVVCRNVETSEHHVGLLFEVRRIVSMVVSSTDLESLNNDPILSKYKSFAGFRRGSSELDTYPEVLIRRVLFGGGLPRRNPIIDISNAVSMLTKIPMTPIDVDRAGQVLKITRILKRESVSDLDERSVVLPRGTIVLVDSQGRVIYVYPYKLTNVAPANTKTRNVAFIGYGAPGVPLPLITSSVRILINYVANNVRGVECGEIELSTSSR